MWPILWCLLLSNDNYLLNILSQPNQPQLNILSQPKQPQLNILSQPNQPQLDILSQSNQPQLDILSQPNQPQLNILSQSNRQQLNFLSQPPTPIQYFVTAQDKDFATPQTSILINKDTDVTYLRFAGFLCFLLKSNLSTWNIQKQRVP